MHNFFLTVSFIVFIQVRIFPLNMRDIVIYAAWWREKYLSKCSLIKHTCSWRDKLMVLWTLNRHAIIFSQFYLHLKGGTLYFPPLSKRGSERKSSLEEEYLLALMRLKLGLLINDLAFCFKGSSTGASQIWINLIKLMPKELRYLEIGLYIVRNSGFCDLLEPYNTIMAGRGFKIKSSFTMKICYLPISPSAAKGA